MLGVSSNFTTYAELQNATFLRKFYIGSSDYSAYILRWPTISKKWDELNPQNITLDLSNANKTFNFLMTDPTQMRVTSSIQLGVKLPNLLRYSEEMQRISAWTFRTGADVYTQDTGLLGIAEIIKCNAGTSHHDFKQPVTTRTSEQVTVSGYFKNYSGISWVGLRLLGLQSAAVGGAFYNIDSGTLGTVNSGCTASMEFVSAGWYRCALTKYILTTSDANAGVSLHTSDAQEPTWTAVGSEALGVTGMMLNEGILKPYHATTTSGDITEYLTMFSGTIDSAQYNSAGCSLTLIDKFKKLSERKIGDSTTPVSYTASSYLVHNLAWYLCTSHGGLSATANSSNPDINYLSWSSWSSVFSLDNVRVSAEFTGQTPLEALKKLANLTQSAIFVEDNKIKFNRFTVANSGFATFTEESVIESRATLDDRELINRAFVSASFNTTSQSYAINISQVDSVSVGRYDAHDRLIEENNVWLVDSVSALNLAQRLIYSGSEMKPTYQVVAPFKSLSATIGDSLRYRDVLFGVADTYRIMSESIDMETGKKTFDINQTQFFNTFRLDYSALDSSDILA